MELDERAVATGAALGFVVAFPGLLLGGLLDTPVFVILVLGGWVSAGFVAGSKRPDSPLTHGIVAALLTFVVGQLLAIGLIAAKGDPQHPAAWIFNAGIAAGCGLIGAALAARRSTRQ